MLMSFKQTLLSGFSLFLSYVCVCLQGEVFEFIDQFLEVVEEPKLETPPKI